MEISYSADIETLVLTGGSEVLRSFAATARRNKAQIAPDSAPMDGSAFVANKITYLLREDRPGRWRMILIAM